MKYQTTRFWFGYIFILKGENMKQQNLKQDDFLRIRIPKDLKEKYKKYCDDNGLSLSKRIRNFIERELENN